jgi:hypothetical protein
VVSVLDKKIKKVDDDARKIEKDYMKNGGNIKQFCD